MAVAVMPEDHQRSEYANADAAHIANHDPARVLAECAAKRTIVEIYEVAGDIPPPDSGWHLMKEALEALAGVYADHPDFPVP